MIAFIAVSIALLAWETIKLTRGPKRPGRALLSVVLTLSLIHI